MNFSSNSRKPGEAARLKYLAAMLEETAAALTEILKEAAATLREKAREQERAKRPN